MADWSFHAFDARSGVELLELSVTSWDHVAQRNDAGSFTARIGLPEKSVLIDSVIAATQPARTIVVPFRNGQPVDRFAGWVPPGGRKRPDLNSLEIAGPGLLGYFDRRILVDGLAYTNVDQFAAAAMLVNAAAPNGIGIDTTQVGTSGVLRTQTWTSSEGKYIGEALRQKAALIGGYDFDIGVDLSLGRLTRRLLCWYPRRGRTAAASGLVFRVGGNVTNIGALSGDDKFADRAIALGEETDATNHIRRRVVAESADLIGAGYPYVDVKLDQSDVKEDATLQAQIDGHFQEHGLEDADVLTFPVDPEDRYRRAWEIGDEGQLVMPVGVDPWRPVGYVDVRRVDGHHWTVDGGGETLEVITGKPWST